MGANVAHKRRSTPNSSQRHNGFFFAHSPAFAACQRRRVKHFQLASDRSRRAHSRCHPLRSGTARPERWACGGWRGGYAARHKMAHSLLWAASEAGVTCERKQSVHNDPHSPALESPIVPPHTKCPFYLSSAAQEVPPRHRRPHSKPTFILWMGEAGRFSASLSSSSTPGGPPGAWRFDGGPPPPNSQGMAHIVLYGVF